MSQWQWLRSFVDRPNFSVPNTRATGARMQVFADDAGSLFQPFNRMLQVAMPHGSGANHQRTVRDRFCQALVFLGIGQQPGGPNGGAGFAERDLVRIHHAQAKETEVAHSSGGRADIERVARGNKHYTKLVERWLH